MGGAAPKYRNGYIPQHELVLIEGNHWATRGTAARWEAMKADVLENEGVTLRITGGENAYRSFAGQTFARKNACAAGRCNDAAIPGFSSHGGSLNGRDSGAIDVNNWAELGKDKVKFYAYCRKHGFEPGYFDWEPWHIIDWAPYTIPATAGGGGSPKPTPNPTPTPIQRAGKNMMYVGRDGGDIFSIPEGGKVKKFASPAEYNLNRDTIATLNGKLPVESRTVLPPDIKDIVFVSQIKINVLIEARGAFS